jgi:phenylalanyl-tRNA synthetase beta chain
VTAFELRLAPVVEAALAEPGYRELSRFPPLRRDVAFVVGARVPAAEVRSTLEQAGGPLLDRVVLFDVFEGDPLPAGTRSLAFALDLRAPDRTLTDEEADAVVRSIAERLQAEFGARLRSG